MQYNKVNLYRKGLS